MFAAIKSTIQTVNPSGWPRVAPALAALLVLCLLSSPGRSEQVDYDRVIDRADQQRLLLEMMSTESILVALEVDAESHLKKLKRTHRLFNEVRVGLREGNAALGLPPAESSEVLDKLSLVDSLWPLFDNTVRKSVGAGKVGRTEIDALAEMSQPLEEALEDTVEAYGLEVNRQQLHSMRFTLISVASHQRTLTQRMAKQFLLIAYGHEARKNKSRLKKTASRFARSLRALQIGDQDQRLIAPPTEDIQAQLEQVNRLWLDFERLIREAVKGDPPNRREIQRLDELNSDLLAALEQTVTLYRKL